ncbi:SCAN domain-containing protein 3 [Eumeta japonica]|uniref:SCAN domain-containing protein 3 n=1 Tax=Eumeta variegata TaxID=151549 RepID=A0A4C1U592_EUMVA|nr:SCAN domain-containing protein 3 [Eumeta japonica]
MHSMFASTSQSNDDGLRASYNISLLIAKSGKLHTIGEQLILPAVEEVECIDEDIHTYSQHLSALHDDFKTRFEDILTMDIPPWIINPFDETEVANVVLQEELLELSTNEELKVKFRKGYQTFWLQAEIPEKYPGLWEIARKFLIAFPSSFLVERSFSAVTNLLTKKRSKLNITERGDLRQGDPLSPKLFSTVLEQIFRRLNWEDLGINVDVTSLMHLKFADDIVLFAKTLKAINKMIEDLASESERIELKLNPENMRENTNGNKVMIQSDNTEIRFINEYIYLEQIITQNKPMRKEVDRRVTNG